MGRLIDADKVLDKMQNTLDMQELYLPIHFKELIIDDMEPIDAIPKADYENRLKADMVAMLTEIQLEIEELKNEPSHCHHFERGIRYSSNIIQQKINSLRGEGNESGNNQ